MLTSNMNLREYNTFGIDVNASSFIELKSEKEASGLLSSGSVNPSDCLILGGGSNILFTGDFNGTVLHPAFNNISIVERDKKSVYIAAEAGVVWDDLVLWAVQRNFGGIENLSLIPGSVGAAPIQNIGAYGVEVGAIITKVRTLSLKDGSVREFTGEECGFGYRSSIFKSELKGKYLICSVYLELKPNPQYFNLSYGDLEKRVSDMGGANLDNVRSSIIGIRKEKLPDPAEKGNAGSFFKNPVAEKSIAEMIAADYPGMPSWPAGEGTVKIPAAWMIEQAGFKGYTSGMAGVHDRQPLVLVNHGSATGSEILSLAFKVREAVLKKFGIWLDFEVNII
ncbi:MAG: UDP-N-acetylmuramate dehydrogenase [Bacteroidia bacterium]|nr:MAG: UDP-N-acetylmuramate dehydrogenase [Bacteroidia bacterium]